MQRYGRKTSKMPQKWGVSPMCDPAKIFFKNPALSLLYPCGALTSCKKLEKTNERSLRYLKTDQLTTDKPVKDGQGPPQENPRSKMDILCHFGVNIQKILHYYLTKCPDLKFQDMAFKCNTY